MFQLGCFAPFVLAWLAVAGLSLFWFTPRSFNMRSRVREELERLGFRDLTFERRWFTCGPFRKGRRWGAYYRIEGADAQGLRQRGWARFRIRWPGQPKDRCVVRWDEPGDRLWWEGMRTAVALPLTLSLVALGWSLFIYVALSAL